MHQQSRPARKWRSIAVASVAILGWLVIAATPVLAHEFTVGILLPPGADDLPGMTFMDGFRLAVDQSPDVSHAPGSNAGDHLGAVDVAVIVVTMAAEPGAATATAMALAKQADVVVIDAQSAVLEVIFGPVTDSRTLLITTSGAETSDFPDTPYFFGAGAPGMYADVVSRSGQSIDDTLRREYGREPSEAGARGYRAARLIDKAVEATGGNFADAPAMQDALAAANNTPTTPADSAGRTGPLAATPPPQATTGPTPTAVLAISTPPPLATPPPTLTATALPTATAISIAGVVPTAVTEAPTVDSSTSPARLKWAIAAGLASLMAAAWWAIRALLIGR